MSGRRDARFALLTEAESPKQVLRATTLADGSRRGNSGKHSWRLALCALVLAGALDRVQPVLHNIASGGGTWTGYGVTFDQFKARVGHKVARGAPRVRAHMRGLVKGVFG